MFCYDTTVQPLITKFLFILFFHIRDFFITVLNQKQKRTHAKNKQHKKIAKSLKQNRKKRTKFQGY